MPSKTLHTNAIVLRKTKLSETDLIISFLCENGYQIRAIAKGARKPSSIFAPRLEIFSNVEVLIAKGKNLDIVREVKLINPFTKIRLDIEKSFYAAPALEFAEKATQQSLNNDNLYPATITFLESIESSDNLKLLKTLCCAYLLKTSSYLGFRPSLANCAICYEETTHYLNNIDLKLNFSYEEGGIVCARCSKNINTQSINSSTIYNIHLLLHTKFNDIKMLNIKDETILQILYFCNK